MTDLFCRFCGHALPALTNGGEEADSSGYGANGVNGDTPKPLARLIVRPQAGNAFADAREYALDGSDVIIGRSQACEIQLDGDQLLSRRHAQIHWNGQNFTITDLGSSNGTLVNDQEINVTIPLHDQDLIVLGEYELLFSERAPSPDAIIPRKGVASTPLTNRPTSNSLGGIPLARTSSPLVTGQESGLTLEDFSYAPGADETQEIHTLHQEEYPDSSQGWHHEPVRNSPTPASLSHDDMDLEQTATNLEAISAQLGQASTLLKRLSEEQRVSEQRRQALASVRDEINSLLAEPAAPGTSTHGDPHAEELAELARQAADHPKQIDHLMQLASRANDIADVLERQRAQAASGDAAALRAQLEAIRRKLDRLV